MMKRFLLAAIAALISTGVWAQQIAPGTLMGNSRATQGPARQEAVTDLLDRALAAVNGTVLCRAAGVWNDCTTPVLGIPTTSTGTLGFAGATSGTATISAQTTAGTPNLLLPNTSGTFAVGASSPLVLSATTGNMTCTTCVTSSGGGAITGTAPIAVSAAGVVSITSPLPLTNGGTNASLTANNGGIVYSGAAGLAVLNNPGSSGPLVQFQNAAAPIATASTYPSASGAGSMLAALTANTITATRAPVLGLNGTATGSLGFSGSSSGTVTIQSQAGAGTYTFGLPTTAGTSGQPMLSGGGGGAAQTYGTLGIAAGGTAQTTAATARASSGLNVESFTGHGDSIYTILATDKVVGTNAAFTASRAWTLPAANAVNAGQPLVVADFQGTVTGTNTIVITRAGADTINGGTTVTINAANGAYILWSDGVSKWTAQAVGSTAVSGVSSLGGLTGAVGVANGIEVSGSNIQITATRRTLPTTQTFLSGSGTYTTAANVLWIEVEMVGAGGGGTGASTNGGTGGNTCWNTSGAACTTPVYQAGGGAGSAGGGAGGIGGTVAGSSTCLLAIAGGDGQGSSTLAATGGLGGSSAFGGAGSGAVAGGNNNGNAGKTNSGGGGGGGTQATTSFQGGGGGAFCKFIINTPAATYTYAVGAAGAAGTGTGAGAAGGSGGVWVIEHYGT